MLEGESAEPKNTGLVVLQLKIHQNTFPAEALPRIDDPVEKFPQTPSRLARETAFTVLTHY